ncbi:MAG: hypothetical protein RL220_1523 [Bacteroidota bacterium]
MMKFLKQAVLLICAITCISFGVKAQEAKADTIYGVGVLTCSPGTEIYSAFGHSAIRVFAVVGGREVDWIYNYGTFDGFAPGFAWRFAQGKLDYFLSKSDFPSFYHDYIVENRGMVQQELDVPYEVKQELFRLLEENYRPENRTYRYNYFYDNCSTRVLEIIAKATGGQMKTTDASANSKTFREAIQPYLEPFPWTDFGIDVALGMPCDYIIGEKQSSFLPDSVFMLIDHSTLNDKAVSMEYEELLFSELEPEEEMFFTPLTTMIIWLAMMVVLTIVYMRLKKNIHILDRITWGVSGLVGVLVLFLWFFTDHKASSWNLNLLWANPFHLFFAFASAKRILGWKWLTRISLMFLVIVIAGWSLIPQRFNDAVFPIAVALMISYARIWWLQRKGEKEKKAVS